MLEWGPMKRPLDRKVNYAKMDIDWFEEKARKRFPNAPNLPAQLFYDWTVANRCRRLMPTFNPILGWVSFSKGCSYNGTRSGEGIKKHFNKWHAVLQHQGAKLFLGTFKTEEEALFAYRNHRRILKGF